ncbi:hypothetical protein Syun_016740 [Stephania yunnanensis]|uniref:Small-subunit processome Utp12 domain-containing protein n=1 Tax=Stephania yunnanensis TaxID=152371 RepID=A0AAP0P2F7_9MAGN
MDGSMFLVCRNMGSSNIRDLLTSYSPSLDFLAICSGDGRIKIWDTLKGQLQTEFTDVASTDGTDFFQKSESGHLSLDYKCMKWVPIARKRKRKVGSSLLVLGTGGGDVLALDVSAGQLKWRISDCHPGGVGAISFSAYTSCIYTAGVDGTVCQIDGMVGNPVGRFRASTKAISSMAISFDGKLLATAAAQLKIFSCSDNKKMQKFTGHPGPVSYMTFTEDGQYLLSCAVGEKSVAIWKIDNGVKKQSACCVLPIEHPAVFLHSKCVNKTDKDGSILYILAISEIGSCYFWYAKDIQELRTNPTKISLSTMSHIPKYQKGTVPSIYAAELQGILEPGSAQVFIAYGSLVKPSFEKVLVRHGEDVKLLSSPDGMLLPAHQSIRTQKEKAVKTEVTALGRANAEDALLPIPKIHDLHDDKLVLLQSVKDNGELAVNSFNNNKSQSKLMDLEGNERKKDEESVTTCMEDQLRSSGVLSDEGDIGAENYSWITNDLTLSSATFSDVHVDAKIKQKIKAAISSMASRDAYKLLTVLVEMWESRSGSDKYVLPCICCLLVYHGSYIKSQEPASQVLDTLSKISESKCLAVQPLLQLSGRMQLIRAQIDKVGQKEIQTSSPDDDMVANGEDEDEDVDELVYREEYESESDSGDD